MSRAPGQASAGAAAPSVRARLRAAAPGLYRALRLRKLRLADALARRSGAYRGVSWLFVLTQPNSGSTALAKLLMSSPRARALQESGEGKWLIPELVSGRARYNPDYPLDHAALRAEWTNALRRDPRGPGVVIEKSPSNMVRMRILLDLFSDMPARVIRLTREPYAVCASWAGRYGPEHLLREWAPDLGDRVASEAGYYETLGRLYGERARCMLALSDLTVLSLAYEDVTDDPGAACAAILAAVPELETLDPGRSVRIKDYPEQPLRNMNAEQAARLTPEQRGWIAGGLAPFAEDVAALGYGIG